MNNSYLSHLDSAYGDKTFKRKVDYIKFNFGREIKKIRFKKTPSVLEIGPGKGEFISYLNSCGIENIDIVDNDSEIINSINKNYKISNSFHSSDIIRVKKKLGKYDIIVLIQLLEHITPLSYFSFIKTIYSKLKKGGVIIVVVPNANNPLGLTERYGDLQHRNSFTEQSLKDLVMGSNIDNYDIEIKSYLIPPYSVVNILRIFLQKILHMTLLLTMIINGGTYFKTMTPNITLIIRKKL